MSTMASRMELRIERSGALEDVNRNLKVSVFKADGLRPLLASSCSVGVTKLKRQFSGKTRFERVVM